MASLAEAAPGGIGSPEAEAAPLQRGSSQVRGEAFDPRIGQYRFRIGDYRIIFDLADDTLCVLEVGHRKEIYR